MAVRQNYKIRYIKIGSFTEKIKLPDLFHKKQSFSLEMKTFFDKKIKYKKIIAIYMMKN